MPDGLRSLRIDFDSEAAFRREYESNIANGGIFIATNVGFDIREAVLVELAFAWCDTSIELEGEIVHVISAKLAGIGGSAGVAVQFGLKASDLRDRFEPIVGKLAIEDEREAGTGRRTARRAPARVPVLIRTQDGREIEGRSRDLSTSGVLVVIGADSLEVGEEVGLIITNPTLDEEIELSGEVMRHVQSTSKGPVGIGIRFLVQKKFEDEVEDFLKEVQVAEHSRRMGGISGPIAEVGIENLLQMFGTCAPQGTLTLLRGEEDGFIVFEHGMLRGARLGDSYGRKALSRLLEWRAGSFEFYARADADLYRGDPIPLDAAMLDALRLHDEGQLTGQDALPENAKLVLDAEKIDAGRAELSQAEEAIVDLASVGMSVSKIIDVIPEPDVEVRQAILGLVARGLISLAG